MRSFLPYDRGVTIPDRVFEDLQTRRIFPERAVRILKYPCRPETLRQRQRLFRLLLCGEFCERFERFHVSLSELRRLDERFKASAENSVVRGLAAAQLIEKYLSVKAELLELCRFDKSDGCKSSDDEPSGGTWCDRLLDLWSDEDESIRERLNACRPAIESIKSFGLSLQGKSWIVPLPDGETYSEQLCRLAESLGFKLSPRNTRETALDSALDDAICRLYPEETSRLKELASLCSDKGNTDITAQSCAGDTTQSCADSSNFSLREAIDTLVGYIDETAFCLEVAGFVRSAAAKGIEYCFARISTEREYIADSLYDVTLLAQNVVNIVPNDVYFDESERFYFLVGANGGGKTTYLRAIGQNLLLFLCGAPVFASSASIYPFRHPETVFADSCDGDVIRERLSEILPDSFLLLNEIYSSLDEERGLAYALDCAARLSRAGSFGLFVTHFYGVRQSGLPLLETLTADDNTSDRAVSDHAASDRAASGDTGSVRTYKIVRATGTASSHALDILKKYRLDPESLRVRMKAMRQREGGDE
ncbi:MAG TPA: hypothetical protein H9681_12705 [Firmicutes bacterium]|nr:hypothetical protein [Bacillota bacterium]